MAKKRADGRVQVSFRTEDGKRHYVYGATKRDAESKKLELMKKLSEGLTTKNITLDKFFATWEDSRKGTIKENTEYLMHAKYVNHIRPALGNCKLAKINFAMCSALQRDLVNKGLKASVVNGIMQLLKSVLKKATDTRMIPFNPMDGIKSLKDTSGKSIKDGSHRYLTRNEKAAFFDAAESTLYYAAFVLMDETGMRCGECMSLSWTDIDWNKSTVSIHRTISKDSDGKPIISEVPKSDAGKRTLRLSDRAVSALKVHRDNMRMLRTVIPFDGLIFSTMDGGINTTANIDAAIYRIVEKVNRRGGKLVRFTAHAFRHGYATDAANSGIPIPQLMYIMGWSDTRQAVRYYHNLENKMMEAMDNIIESRAVNN